LLNHPLPLDTQISFIPSPITETLSPSASKFSNDV